MKTEMTHFEGVAHQAATFLQNEHLLNADMWKKFVDVYRSQPDGINGGWRGEYWGKMMRGAALVYGYTRDERLYKVLTDSVRDILTVSEADGRVSSYTRDTEFNCWDIWGRKYVLLGCEYYLEICADDELVRDIIAFCTALADYILERVGKDGRKITETSAFWCGLNSSSILEPILILYRLTGEQRYFDFASYIVEEGGTACVNVFELAYENHLYPYQYGVSKAYELTSCFEGLLEYYKVTGIEKYKTAVLNYAQALLGSEISIIGSSGITHELFDHTLARQTSDYDGVKQETCVTVTLMKFFSRLLELTGSSEYADAIEKSFYNAYLGALNVEHCDSDSSIKMSKDKSLVLTDLPFDSYSPLTAAKRGRITGGFQILPDLTYYGCCACIGAAGVGVFLKHAVVVDGDNVTVNFYERGRVEFLYNATRVALEINTDYPVDGRVEIRVLAEKGVEFNLRLRNPAWAGAPRGYAVYRKVWSDDSVEINFNMPIELHLPEIWKDDIIYTDFLSTVGTVSSPTRVTQSECERNYFAITRGPLTLAADGRTGKPADSVFSACESGTLCEPEIIEGTPCLLKIKFEPKDCEPYFLVDYAHAGRDWNTKIAAWLKSC